MNSHCRIGKVVPKKGIYLLPSVERPQFAVKENRHLMETTERQISKLRELIFDQPLAGCVNLVWTRDGEYSVGFYIDKNSPFGLTMMPLMIAEYLRREVAGQEASNVLERYIDDDDPGAA